MSDKEKGGDMNGCKKEAETRQPRLPANVGPQAAEENPFQGYKIDDWRFLEDLGQRSSCPKCKKSRKYFCYTCYVPVVELEGKIPVVKLPIKVDIIKHSREIDGKSTAAHAAVLAPHDVTIYTYPCIPDYDQTSGKVVLVFPDKKAVSVQKHLQQLRDRTSSSSKRPRLEGPASKIERAVFIDSTWNQSRGIYKDIRLRSLPCVILESRVSQFWRHQEGSPRWYLATVEAVHQLLMELAAAEEPPPLPSDGSTPGTTDGPASLALPVPSDPSSQAKSSPPPTDVTPDPTLVKANSPSLSSQSDRSPVNQKLCQGAGNLKNEPSVCHDYDNLLFFFQFMYDKIHKLYDADSLQAYKRPLDI